MQRKPSFWFLLSLLCVGGALYFWHLGDQWQAQKISHKPSANPPTIKSATDSKAQAKASSSVPSIAKKSSPGTSTIATVAAAAAKAKYPYRLSNTGQTMNQLVHNDKAILLANALIDTGKPMDLAIPDRLRAPANSGSYIVQARGSLDDQFRSLLQNANATIVSYIPNNAYLVRVSDAGAQQLSAAPQTQSVMPFEPYYKLDASLLKMAMEEPNALPSNGKLNVTLFPDSYQPTVNALQQLGAQLVSQDRSPFGPVLTVQPLPGTLSTIASLPGVQGVAGFHSRVHANDLDRPRLNVAVDSITPMNYLGLTGTNVLININDGGVDAQHPDLKGRLTSDFPAFTLVDNDGHGTHVAGTIMGNGSESSTVTHAVGSVTNANFRGMAPGANAYVMSIDISTDSYLQEQAAKTNAFISNNSWNYEGSSSYDIEAASYDAAVRDALPEVTGSQPVLYVFSAGNDGGGGDDGTSGSPDTILSPGTAKNVITVGAVEQPRNITNTVVVDGVTNTLFYTATDSDNQVASFSSLGNVGVNVEGTAGRFKPDLVAPGTFVISDRSTKWDTAAYYNPTNYTENDFTGLTVDTNTLLPITTVSLQQNMVAIIVTVFANRLSPSPFPAMPIYVALNRTPTTADFVGTNQIVVPTNAITFSPGVGITFSVGNTSTQTVNFDASVLIVSTNDNGYYIALSNLNNGVGPYYRYESGTSMAAAGVSGMLANMQEFFAGRLHLTNSPALMKALLINGARPLGTPYDYQAAAQNGNAQGWGLPSLPNSIPGALAGLTADNGNTMPLIFYDQSPTNLLATGQSRTLKLGLTPNAQNQDMRVTLVWTDPPGNPAAGTKLVNDLDLIVTNLDTGDVFLGNDILAGSIYNEGWDTNSPPNFDSVNNVENVFLRQPLGTNYSITVLGRRVNVNAVTANTNGIVQDYALVVSSGDAGVVASPFTNITFTIPTAGFTTNIVTNLTVLSNALPLFNQRVGANSQFSGSTNGTVSQWNFYVYTNTTAFTNVAFVTFVPPELGTPRMGASEEIGAPDTNATHYLGADIDLYVSTSANLTNLDTNVLANAFSSTTRTGTEKVLITNSSAGKIYYLGVKSEDQQGAQFDLIGVATQLPFNQTDSQGNTIVTMLTPFPVVIPPGGPGNPNHALLLGVSTSTATVRKIVVTNTVTHQDFGDLIGTLTHAPKTDVLNSHSFFVNSGDLTETLVYDDSGENEFAGSRTSDGPGSLQNFVGDNASAGVWMFTMVNDSSLSDTGLVANMVIMIEPHQPANNGFYRTIAGNSWYYDYADVPPNATNLTISLSQNTQPLDLYLKQGDFPTQGSFDKSAVIPAGGGSLSISKFESPPLNAGRYFFGIFNPSAAPVTVFITVEVDLSLAPIQVYHFVSIGNEPILDDAVTNSTIHVGLDSAVVSAEVGVRIDHPRESDLVLTLISPQGTRVLLAENRGGLDTNGYGSGTNITLAPLSVSSGGAARSDNIISNINANMGLINISYDFFTVPDDMRIYYDGTAIFDTGLISGSGTISVPFGPGNSNSVEIIMNEFGTASTNGDAWDYTANIVAQNLSYAVFSEDTNLAQIPIKFAVPPFGGAPPSIPAQNELFSGFENVTATNYGAGTTVDGWTVLDSNQVTVVTVPALADTGANVLALHGGSISRTLPTVAGETYTLTFANHGRPSLHPVGWWKAEGNLNDSADGNTMQDIGSTSVAYNPGTVGEAFGFVGNTKLWAPDATNLVLTNAVSLEGWVNSYNAGPGIIIARGDSRSGFDPYTLSVNPPQAGGQTDLAWQITDSSGNSVPLFGSMTLNTFNHVAGTYSFNGTNALMVLYINGVQVAFTNTTIQPIGVLTFPDPCVGIGNRPDLINGFGFTGLIDEITIHSNALSAAQVQDIYAAGSAGKDPVGATPPVTANVILGNITNTISGIDQWTPNSYTFIASSNNMVLTIIADANPDGFGNVVRDGMLLDSFNLVRNAQPNPANYYLPEESLDKLVGEGSLGDWQLEVLDNRTGATNPAPNLVSWQLSLVLADKVPFAIPLNEGLRQTNSVGPNGIVYFLVDVPAWASFATNILTANGPVNLLFNQNILPTGTNATDFTLIASQPAGTVVLSTNGVPPLVPGQRYYLGVQNPSATTTVNFTLEVDFDITTLSNAVPVTSTISAGNIPRYFQFDVASNAVVTAFQILNPSGNVELVVSKGVPLPDTSNFSYISAVPGANPQSIIVLTNSNPVPLGPGRWYLGVFNNDVNSVTYTILATEGGPPNIIQLTNGVSFNFNSPPGLALTNFFVFPITSNYPSALFELVNLTGNVDLTLQRDAIPYVPPFFALSAQPGTNREQIVIRTNNLGTNIIASWYLGVPNNTISNVSYTIRAVVSTNGMLISSVPINVVATLPPFGSTIGPTLSWPSVVGELYDIQISSDLVTWTTIATVTATGETMTFTDPSPITGGPGKFYRVIQVP